MFPSSVRITVALLLFVLGTFLLSIGRGEGAFLVLAALYWLFTLIRYGTVIVAFKAYKQGRMDRMRELIEQVWKPRLLARRYRAYYHWLRGVVAMEDDDLDRAREEFIAASTGRFWRETDRAVLEALLAQVELERGDRAAARQRLESARATEHLPDLDPLLDDLAARIDSSSGQP